MQIGDGALGAGKKPTCPRDRSTMRLVKMRIPIFSQVGKDTRERRVWKCTKPGCCYYGPSVYKDAPPNLKNEMVLAEL